MTPGRTAPFVREDPVDPTIAAIVAEEERSEEEAADEWLRSLPRRERRRLFRAYGIARGERRSGGGQWHKKGAAR